MSGRGYNKNMKSGDAAPRHPNTNNYQQSNSRQNANYHPMSSNNKTQGHNTLTNNPPHLQQPHVTHNLQNPMSHSHSINPLNTIIHPNYTSGRQQQINHARNQPMSNLRAPYNPTRPLNPQSYPFPVYNDPNLYYLPNMYPTQVPPGPYLLSQNFYGTGISPLPGPGMMQQMASTTAPISNQGRMQPSGPPAQPPTSMPNDVMTNQSIQIDANSMKIPSSQPQPTQLSHPQVPHTRKKNVARIQDPTTGEEKDLNEIAKLSIDQSANQNANSQVTVTNQVIVLENHNDQISNKNDEKPSQEITVEKKTVEQAPTQTNRNNQNQQEQLPKQQDAPVVVEQEKINKTDEKVVEHKKIEHKQPLLQNPVKPDIDNNVNNKRESTDDKLDVNKETPKTPMINLEEKLDKLQINDSSVKSQDEKPQQQPEKAVVVNNKEEPRAPESKADKKIEQINTAPDKKPEEQQDKPPVQQQQQQQNVQKAQVNVQPSNQSEPQVKQNVPAVKPQQSAEVKKSNQVKAQSKSTEIISYDVEFLKKLQYSSFSIEKPNFGNLNQRVEILLNEPRRQDDSSNDFDPHYLRMNSNRNSVSHGHRSMQMGPRAGDKVPRKILATSLNDEVKLNKSENAWTQAFKGKKKAANFPETTEGLIARARGMLNKLTPQNFDKLSKDFCDLAIDTEDKLKKMIELIFDKAVDEPAFCEQYAMLCKIMSSISVKVSEDNKEKIIKFNTLLLERCQTCFEKDKYQDLNLDERLKKIAECDDKEKKQQLIDELDEEKRLVRKKSLGNIKLIGALYKNNRLKDEIMNLCIDTLINDNQEDSLECLCSLLKSIGEKYEKSNPKKAQFNNQMNKLEAIVRENKIASRIKFLIMDILDMRKENWKPRKLQEGNKPKKIEEVHEDIKKEEEQSNIQYSQLAKRGNDSMKKRNDNWMGSGSRKSQQSSNDAISNLRKLNEQRNNSPNLGPGGPTFTMGMSFGSWSQGASGAKSSLASTSQDKKINQWQQRNQTNDRSQQAPQPVKPKFRGNYTLSQDGDFDFIAQLSDFLKSYIKSSQIDGLINSIYDNCTEDSVHLFVVAAIDCACESLLKNIDQVGELLANLVIKERVISFSQFHKGLKHHLDQSEDIVTDVPKFHEYIGQILSHFYNKLPDNERRSFFKEALQPCIPLNTSLLMVIHMIKYLTRADVCQDISEIAKKWVASNLDWSDFLKEDSEQYLKESLKKYDLSEFVVELNNCKLITNKSVETSNLVNQILTSKFDEVSKILEKNISSNDKELSKKLISAFIERCILDSTDFDNPSKSCDKNYTFNESKFESQIKSISLDLFNDEEYQLEVIYSACKVNHDRSNPKDLLFNLFNFFLTEINLVKKDTFVKWYKENSSRVGNGIAIMNMKRFIGNLIKLSDTNED